MSPSRNSNRPSRPARFSRAPVERLSITRTLWPSATRRWTRCEPMKPAPPVTRQVVGLGIGTSSGRCGTAGAEPDLGIGLDGALERRAALEHLHVRPGSDADVAAALLHPDARVEAVQPGLDVELHGELELELAVRRQGDLGRVGGDRAKRPAVLQVAEGQ